MIMRRNRPLTLSSSHQQSNNGNNKGSGGDTPLLPLHHQQQQQGSSHCHNGNSITPRAPSRKNKVSSYISSSISTAAAAGGVGCLIVLLVVAVLTHHQHHRMIPTQRSNYKSSALHSSLDAAVPSIRILQKEPEQQIYDVVIAGAGASGLSAALFAARAGLSVMVLGSEAGGLLAQTKQLDNFPSFSASTITGEAWLQVTKKQALDFGAEFAPPGLLATSLERWQLAGKENEGNVFFTLHTHPLVVQKQESSSSIHAYSVIVASGATPRTLGLPNEKQLWGVSLHSCAICDGHLYSGSSSAVIVVGGGDAALDAAILLARYASKVYLVHRRTEFTSVNHVANLQLVQSISNVEMLTPYLVEEWDTDGNDDSKLVGVKLKHNSQAGGGEDEDSSATATRHLQVDGAFVMIGATPNTDWIQSGVGADLLDEEGLIRLAHDHHHDGKQSSSLTTETLISGMFAAGEVTDKIYKQAITAASAGAQAAIDAERWLRERRGVTLSKHAQNKRIVSASAAMSNTNRDNNVVVAQKADEQQALTSTNTTTQQHERQDAEISQIKASDNDDSCDLTQEDCIRSIVRKYPVVVFSKPWCPYCRKAVEALSLAGVHEPYIIDLSQHDNTKDIQARLKFMTGRRTVPNVFIGGTSIGGGDETLVLQRSGKLVPRLKEAGALEKELDEKATAPPLVQ